MKKHTKIYLDYFGFHETDFIPCEICKRSAQDIHHLNARGMGGSKSADKIENLMAVCRICHIEFGDKKQFKEELQEIHNEYLKRKNRRG